MYIKNNDFYFLRRLISDLPLNGAYLVGGVVRDLILNRPYTDIDVAIAFDPRSFAQKVASYTKGNMVRLGKPPREIYRVVSSGYSIDISALHGKCIHEDLRERDFTLNSLAYNLKSGEIIDPYGGIYDIHCHKIRMTSTQSFDQDPLRILRAFRFGAELQFKIESETLHEIKEKAILIKCVASERIREELFKTVASKNSYPYLSIMATMSILLKIFSEFDNQSKSYPSKTSDYPLLAYYHLEVLLNHPLIMDYNRSLSETSAHVLLKFAMLILVQAAGTIDTCQNYRQCLFCKNNIDIILAAKQICFRLRLSKKQIRYIESVLGGHQMLFNIFINYRGGSPLNRKTARFFIKYGNLTSHILYLLLAEIQGSNISTPENMKLLFSFSQKLMNMYQTRIKSLLQKPSLLNGTDLIRYFGISPSPAIRNILSVLEEERLLGKITTRKDALKRAKELIFSD